MCAGSNPNTVCLQTRSQDFSLWGGGGGGRLGACSPGKILEFLDCLGLHFARFHAGGERDCRVVKRKRQSQVLDLLKI